MLSFKADMRYGRGVSGFSRNWNPLAVDIQ